jgi:hypothetical protein
MCVSPSGLRWAASVNDAVPRASWLCVAFHAATAQVQARCCALGLVRAAPPTSGAVEAAAAAGRSWWALAQDRPARRESRRFFGDLRRGSDVHLRCWPTRGRRVAHRGGRLPIERRSCASGRLEGGARGKRSGAPPVRVVRSSARRFRARKPMLCGGEAPPGAGPRGDHTGVC